MLLLLSSYVEDLAAHIDSLSGKQTTQHMGESYSPLESLYSVLPILAQICNDGNTKRKSRAASSQSDQPSRSRTTNDVDQNDVTTPGEESDVIDRLLLERTVDLINQVVQV